MPKAIIFDCFGVLITDALEMLRADLVAQQPAKAAEIEDIITASNRGFLEPRDAINRLAELSGRSHREVRQAIARDEVKDTRLMDYIVQLRTTHQTALLSNISGEGLRQRFTTQELERCFDVALASGDIGFAKPEPEAYEIVADHLNVRLQDCLMVDDRQVCIDGARAVGMAGLRYRSLEQFKRQLQEVL